MQSGWRDGDRCGAGAIAMMALALCVSGAGAQGVSQPPASTHESGPQGAAGPGRILREMKDPHTGARWLLFSNAQIPAGPGRLVIATGQEGFKGVKPMDGRAPVIHPGDKVVVEEHTAAVEAYLEAVALEPAAIGSPLKVRLKIGSMVVRAVATAPGRAALAR